MVGCKEKVNEDNLKYEFSGESYLDKDIIGYIEENFDPYERDKIITIKSNNMTPDDPSDDYYDYAAKIYSSRSGKAYVEVIGISGVTKEVAGKTILDNLCEEYELENGTWNNYLV